MLKKAIPQRVSLCQDCGAEVVSRTCPRRLCDACAKEHKRATARRVMTERRLKRGIAPVKGTTINCGICQAEIVRNGIARRFCAPCNAERQAETARSNSAKKRATAEGRAYINKRASERRKGDPAFCVAAHMRVMMGRALSGGKQGRSWKTFVPYSLDDLMRHLERQFTKGMSWDNRGEWHEDHIVPLCRFSFADTDDAEFKAAFALSNLRPLWGHENVRKNGRRTHLL